MKLSELKSNEYVFCATKEEAVRITGVNHPTGGRYISNERVLALTELGTSDMPYTVYSSLDFDDHKEPKPVRPILPFRKGTNVYGVIDVVDIKYWNDLNKYTDHIEGELNKVKSGRFRVKSNRTYSKVTIDNLYEVIFEYDNWYLFYNDIGALNQYHSGFFTKV